jgi:hypothetical protein
MKQKKTPKKNKSRTTLQSEHLIKIGKRRIVKSKRLRRLSSSSTQKSKRKTPLL